MFKSAGLAKMFAGRRKFFRGPHVRHLWSRLNSRLILRVINQKYRSNKILLLKHVGIALPIKEKRVRMIFSHEFCCSLSSNRKIN